MTLVNSISIMALLGGPEVSLEIFYQFHCTEAIHYRNTLCTKLLSRDFYYLYNSKVIMKKIFSYNDYLPFKQREQVTENDKFNFY